MLGMLYRSRIQESLHKATTLSSREEHSVVGKQGEEVANNFEAIDGSSESDNDVDEHMNSRQRLALTIRNWSVIPENDAYLLREGAVHAIIALAGTDDHRIKQYCASTIFHLSSRATNRKELLSLGAATGVITIAMSVRHWYGLNFQLFLRFINTSTSDDSGKSPSFVRSRCAIYRTKTVVKRSWQKKEPCSHSLCYWGCATNDWHLFVSKRCTI